MPKELTPTFMFQSECNEVQNTSTRQVKATD